MKFFRNPVLIIVSIVSVLAYNLAYADPGETDEKGGHYNRQTGEYHYHNAPPAQNESAIETPAIIETQALANAKRDAQNDHEAWKYIAYGCCAGVFGILYAYIDEPTVKTERLLGKSPEYVSTYIDEYKKIARRRQLGYTTLGCLIWVTYGSQIVDSILDSE